jgi:hypothetical protein
MTVYVDEIVDYGDRVKGQARRWGTRWSHLSCGGDCEELHRFAQRLGLRRQYAQHMDRPDHYYHHYDVTPPKRQRALALGAVFKPAREAAHEYLQRRRLLQPTGASA